MTTDQDDPKTLSEDESFETQAVARPATLFNPRLKLGIVFALVTAGLIYFAATAFNGATVNYSTVSYVAASGPTAEGRQVGVVGKLVQESYVRSADGVTANFQLMDEDGSTVRVRYSGEIGQVFFNDHSEITIKGRLGSDQVFEADTLTVRCPSKYVTEEERAEIEAQDTDGRQPPPYQPDYFDKRT